MVTWLEAPLAAGWGDLSPHVRFTVLGVVGVAALAFALVSLRYVLLWFRAVAGNTGLSAGDLLRIRRAGLDLHFILDCAVLLGQVGEQVSAERFMEHVRAGGHLDDVARGICLARVSNVPLEFEQACKIDLTGHNVQGCVTSALESRDVYIPDPETGDERISACCADGVSVSLWVRATVRTNISRLVDGIGESELVERIGHAVRDAAGKIRDHRLVLKRPEDLAARLRGKRHDRDASLDVLSIDVVDARAE